MRRHHHPIGLVLVHAEHRLEHLHDELARRVVVVEQDHFVERRALRLECAPWCAALRGFWSSLPAPRPSPCAGKHARAYAPIIVAHRPVPVHSAHAYLEPTASRPRCGVANVPLCERNTRVALIAASHGGPPCTFSWIIIIGFVAGIIARFLAPGPNNPAGFHPHDAPWHRRRVRRDLYRPGDRLVRPDQGAGLIGAVVGALIVLFVWHRLVATSHRAIPGTPLGLAARQDLLPLACKPCSYGRRPSRPRDGKARRPPLDHDGARRADAAGDGDVVDVFALPHAQDGAARLVGGISISEATISICSLRSSVSPAPRRTASSTVGGSRRTRRRPSLVSHTSVMCAPALFSFCRAIIGLLPHCSK